MFKDGNLFTTEELMYLSGMKRRSIDYCRKEKIVTPVSERPLLWNYETIILCFMISKCKEKMTTPMALEVAKMLLKREPHMEFTQEKNVTIAVIREHLMVLTSEFDDGIENPKQEIIRYFEGPEFLLLDELSSGKKMQIVLDDYYVFYMDLARKHINGICVDAGLERKIPSKITNTQSPERKLQTA